MRAFEGCTIAGKYLLERFLDEGNFGAVYRACQLAYGVELRKVAIKIAKRPMTETEAQRVFGEALVMARLFDETPDALLRRHFVGVYDAGLCPEGGPLAAHPYVAMELVRGGSLKRYLRVGPFPLTRAVDYFDQILKAVAFMHKNNLVHRDLKPGNVLVTRTESEPDVLKVSDFGLVVEVNQLISWVPSGGDLAYLAPESFSHNICSPQSDVYMLGLVFYEMLLGANPFETVGTHLRGADEETHPEMQRLHLAARHRLDLRPLRQHEEVKRRPALGEVICSALQLDMHSRKFTNACDMLVDWESVKTQTATTAARDEPPWDQVRRLVREAKQYLRIGDNQQYEFLLFEAVRLNSNRAKVPDRMLFGETYLLAVECLLQKAKIEKAGTLAAEGYQRLKSRGTCLAMVRYYAAAGSPAAAGFQREANAYPEES